MVNSTFDNDLDVIYSLNFKQIQRKGQNTFLGIVQGVLVDNEVNQDEFKYMMQWLESHPEVINDWPANEVYAIMCHIVEDGMIAPEELVHLRDVLAKLVGGPQLATTSEEALPTMLPVDSDCVISFPDQIFCFTGEFIYGRRASCIKAVEARGAKAINSVTKDLNYLVIGSVGSQSWATASYGTKIEKAMAHKQKGRPVYIIDEEMWYNAINN